MGVSGDTSAHRLLIDDVSVGVEGAHDGRGIVTAEYPVGANQGEGHSLLVQGSDHRIVAEELRHLQRKRWVSIGCTA